MQQKLSEHISIIKPKLIYISGRTCSGKTTLSHEIEELDYKKIELDKIVESAVMQAYSVTSSSEAFIAAYRGEGPEIYTTAFISEAQKIIHNERLSGSQLVAEGAIAKGWIFKEVFADYLDELLFVYLLPRDIKVYAKRIETRFIDGVAHGTTGLPKDFWALVSQDDVDQFLNTGKLGKLKDIFIDFAVHATRESRERLTHLQESFPDIYVVEF
ncbi:MAG: hypothetical protein Q8P93_00060 [bacterium]|nr:hypothetical protein [bacterium]